MEALYDVLNVMNEPGRWLDLLLACTWKSVLLLGAAWLAARVLLRGASASARHWVWSTALVCVLLLPVLTVSVPGWTVALPQVELPAVSAPLIPPTPTAPTVEPVPPAPPASAPPAVAWTPREVPEAPAEAPAVPATPSLETRDATALRSSIPGPVSWSTGVLLFWLLGMAAVLGYFMLGTLRAWWWSRSAQPMDDGRWKALLDDLSWELGLRRPVSLAWSDRAISPMTCGVWRPVVLLPHSAERWPADRRRVVLLHELAHVQRWDTLVQALAQITCAVYWFNPLVWWGARQLRIERERACDDHVLAHGTRASAYAEHLLDVARSFKAAPGMPLGAVAMARKSQLEGRLLAILAPDIRRGARRAVTAITAVFFVAAVLPLAAMRPATPEEELRPSMVGEHDAWAAATAETEEPAPAAWPEPKAKAAAQARAYSFSTNTNANTNTDDVTRDGRTKERTVTRRTFDVAPGGLLDIQTDRGSIEVESGQGTQLVVEVTREGDEDEIDDFALRFEQHSDGVRVRGEYGGQRWGRGDDLRVHFVVTVPRRYHVDLTTSGGSIAVDDLEGEVRTKTSGGSLRFGHITGPVYGKTSGGSISLESSEGNASLNTSGGSISLGDVRGDVEAHTSGGSIRIGAVRGTVEAKTSGGSIAVDEVAGDIDASTSGGSVTARITKQPQGRSRLTTSGGSVTVHLAGGIGVDVDARTSHGRVTTDFDVPESAFDEDHESLEASINGGGPELYLRTSAGRIRIERIGGDRGSATPLGEPVPSREWEQAVEQAVETSHGAAQAALRDVLHQMSEAGNDSWLGRQIAFAAAEALEALAYETPELEVNVDGELEQLCLLDVLTSLPDDLGRPALKRLAERHGDARVRAHASRLIDGADNTCDEDGTSA